MTSNVIQNIELSLELDDAEYQCQVIDVTLTLPGSGVGESVEVACPDGVVSEPGARTNGSLTGNVFTDPTDTGITWILATAFQSGAEVEYTVVYWPNEGATKAIEFTGRARVNSFTLPFSKPGNARHALDLSLVTADMARPA
jgi:hypothetical protein